MENLYKECILLIDTMRPVEKALYTQVCIQALKNQKIDDLVEIHEILRFMVQPDDFRQG